MWGWIDRFESALDRFAEQTIGFAGDGASNALATDEPVLSVKIDNPATHSPPTKRFEAIVDSGAPDCYFHASIGRAIGLKFENGVKGDLSGIVQGAAIQVYYHYVSLYVGADRVCVRAGFSDAVSVAGILGRRGFFDNFIITFDPSLIPPGFDIQRLGRA